MITKVDGEPKLDGVTDEALWNKARPVTIHTQQGENFGGSGESTVEVRAVHNGEKVFFAIRWTDPTRSLRRIPMIKKEDGWHVADSRAGMMDVVDFYEDKLAIIFSDKPAIGGVRRLQPRPRPPARRQAAAAATSAASTSPPTAATSTCGSGRPRAAACSAGSTTSISARRATRAPTRPPTRRAIRAATGTIRAAPTTRTTTSPS